MADGLGLRLIADAIDGHGGSKSYPLSAAVYDIAKAINNRSDPDLTDLQNAICQHGEAVERGLMAIADAIRDKA